MCWLTAVQSQNYYGAKWALGLRLEDALDTDLFLPLGTDEQQVIVEAAHRFGAFLELGVELVG